MFYYRDFIVKVINLDDSSLITYEEHEAPILSVSLDPNGDYVASSSCDGSVKLWSKAEKEIIKSWASHHPKCNDLAKSNTLARMSWHPSGSTIAIPDEHSVQVFQRGSWNLDTTLKLPLFQGISLCSFNFDGSFLAAANAVGQIVVWNMENILEPIAIFVPEEISAVTAIKWHPAKPTVFAFANSDGKFSTFAFTSDKESASKKLDTLVTNLYGIDPNILDEDFTEEEFDASHKLSKNQENDEIPIKKTKKRVIIDDDEDDEPSNVIVTDINDELVEASLNMPAQDDYNDISFGGNGDEDGDNEFDIGALKKKYDAQIFNDKPAADDKSQEEESEPRPTHAEKIKVVRAEPKLQRPFQPGSTPVTLEQRFMVWNDVGIVRCYNTDDENSIDVEFHDTATHHSIHHDNSETQYSIAALSNDALVFANKNIESSSRLACTCLFLSIDVNKKWEVNMPSEEFIECLAIGANFIAVATDQRYVRLFSLSGVQIGIFSITGPPVTMSAQEKSLMVVYHSGCPTSDDQNLSMFLFKIDSQTAIIRKQITPNSIALPLSPKSLLTWAGFTEEGTPSIVDMSGVVKLYTNYYGNTWIPIASLHSTHENKLDTCFVIGVSEVQQQIRHIFCKGLRYPMTIPRPTVSVSPFELPSCEKETSRRKLEEKHLRAKLAVHLFNKLLDEGFEVDTLVEQNTKIMIDSLVRMFATAVDANSENLALEIARLMPNQKAIELASRYAKSKKRTALATQLNDVMIEKVNEVAEEVTIDENMSHCPSPHRNSEVLIEKQTEQNLLKPKSLITTRKNKGSDDEHEQPLQRKYKQQDSDNGETLRPKPTTFSMKNALNPFSRASQKRSRQESNEDDGLYSSDDEDRISKLAFDEFYKANKSRLGDDNSEMDDDDLKSIARDEFDSISSDDKDAWIEVAKTVSKKKKLRY